MVHHSKQDEEQREQAGAASAMVLLARGMFACSVQTEPKLCFLINWVQCRRRWKNFLNADLKTGGWSPEVRLEL
jgi:hypothetical protein